MKSRIIDKSVFFVVFLGIVFMNTSCERHEYCAVCWENYRILTIGSGDLRFCSDEAWQVDDFIYDYEYRGYYCEFRD